MAVLKSSRLEGIEVVFNNSFLPKNRKPNKVVQIEKWHTLSKSTLGQAGKGGFLPSLKTLNPGSCNIINRNEWS